MHQQDIQPAVAQSLAEDIGSGDITASLIAAETDATARVITRDDCTICGTEWVNEVFKQVDPNVQLDWQVSDGDKVAANSVLFTATGKARSLLTGERAALNFLQLLSGTATVASRYAQMVEGTQVQLLDTRKTIPGLRTAQKYAVKTGGCYNHRIGLYDAFLIKENHIEACGSISNAISQAKASHPGKPVEIEIENQDELEQALAAGADIIMLDNYTPAECAQAVTFVAGRAKLEASGGINDSTLRAYAESGVDFISMGVLTKDAKSVDLSMRVTAKS